MRRTAWIAGLWLCLVGCVSPAQERARFYNEDGVRLFAKGAYADARDSFRAALDLRPDDAGLLYNVGECYDRMGDAARAESYYQQCLRREPNHPTCRHALAVLLVRTGRKADAEVMIATWLASQPKLAAAYAEDGWRLHESGDLPQAQARLQQALDLDPHDPRALTELALVYEDLHRPDRALVLYERALKRDPKQADVAERVQFLLTKGAGKPRPE
jgi:Tfp pilus assembly protein PilF